jgi:hypothetical protein
VYKTKLAPDESVCVRIDGTRTFVKAKLTKSSQSSKIELAIEAPNSVTIERNPKAGEAHLWPDHGRKNREAEALRSREKAEQKRKREERDRNEVNQSPSGQDATSTSEVTSGSESET